jgi:hypothetical protein
MPSDRHAFRENRQHLPRDDEACNDQTLPQNSGFRQSLGEQMNLVATEPAVVATLEQQLKQLVELGRSTPGDPQQNDVAVRWER